MHSDIFADPWLKEGKSRELPDDAALVCTYELAMQLEVIEDVFLRRTAQRDELWLRWRWDDVPLALFQNMPLAKEVPRGERLSDVIETGCAYAVPSENDELSACLRLLDRLFRDRVGFCWPNNFMEAGIVDEAAFAGLVGRIKQELDGNAEKTRQGETEIIRVARELKLNPEPTGTGASHWQAKCPGTHHPLYINAATASFGCGWCKRKGGLEELRAFVQERRGSPRG